MATYNDLEDDDEDGVGVYAEKGAQVTVLGDVGGRIGVYAKDIDTKVTVHGSVSQGSDLNEYEEKNYVKVGNDSLHRMGCI